MNGYWALGQGVQNAVPGALSSRDMEPLMAELKALAASRGFTIEVPRPKKVGAWSWVEGLVRDPVTYWSQAILELEDSDF